MIKKLKCQRKKERPKMCHEWRQNLFTLEKLLAEINMVLRMTVAAKYRKELVATLINMGQVILSPQPPEAHNHQRSGC